MTRLNVLLACLSLLVGGISLSGIALGQDTHTGDATSPANPTDQTGEETAPGAETHAESREDLPAGQPPESLGVQINRSLDAVLVTINGVLARGIFFNVTGDTFQAQVHEQGQPVFLADGTPKMATVEVPVIVALLAFGGVFFTFYYKLINLRGFRHAILVVRGKYDRPEDVGEISHFRALTSALSATVGLGNIAGVAIAIQLGGPGAVFWMIVAAFFGMATKFSSCTLAQLYRAKNKDGSVSGGPMYYLDLGLRARGGVLAKVGKGLAIVYAVMIMGGAIGGGNMFQANQSFEAFRTAFGVGRESGWLFGLAMATLVGAVILGGIRRIGAATARIVPIMVGIYVLASLLILGTHVEKIPQAFRLVFEMAFSENAAYGGVVGVLVWGVKRASFSNEAGLGSSAIAHAAAKTDEPIREGLVAMLEPFIDTVIVCTMTALVVIVTGAWTDPAIPASAGVSLTTAAFATVLPWFPKLLSVCVLLFAYSTMISWCYYGERGWIYLLDHFGGRGLQTVAVFRVVFVLFVFVGSVARLGAVLEFSDLLILCMAFPNIAGSLLLAPKVRATLDDYFERIVPADRERARSSSGAA